MKIAQQEKQLPLNIKYQKGGSIIVYVKKFFRKIGVSPYLRDEIGMICILGTLLFSGLAIYLIKSHFNELPQEIALLYHSGQTESVLKDKNLIYFPSILIPILMLLTLTMISKLYGKQGLGRAILLLYFIISIVEYFAINKIIGMYIYG